MLPIILLYQKLHNESTLLLSIFTEFTNKEVKVLFKVSQATGLTPQKKTQVTYNFKSKRIYN